MAPQAGTVWAHLQLSPKAQLPVLRNARHTSATGTDCHWQLWRSLRGVPQSADCHWQPGGLACTHQHDAGRVRLSCRLHAWLLWALPAAAWASGSSRQLSRTCLNARFFDLESCCSRQQTRDRNFLIAIEGPGQVLLLVRVSDRIIRVPCTRVPAVPITGTP